MRASEWGFDRIKEAFDLVAKDEAEKMCIVQEIMVKNTDSLLRIIALVGGQGGVTMSYLCPNCNSFHLEDYVWWVSAGKTTKWWSAICGEMYDWKQPNRLLVVQTRVEQAKVFHAHVISQGLCENLINALSLLANQQEDGDGLLQSIVTNLGKGSRKGLTDGLRGTGNFKSSEAKVPEGGSDVTTRESPGELTLRAEEVNTLKAYMDVNHKKSGKMGPSPG